MDIRQVNLSHIRRDGGTQARAEMNQSAVEEYAQAMDAGAKFPPVVLFQDQDTYWLGDGFHRVAAALKARKKSIQADIRQGGQRHARLFALGANATHGVRRTNADKRLAVSILLDDPEWSQWSNRQISETVGVSHQFINNMRNERVATVASSSKRDADNPAPVGPQTEAEEPDPTPFDNPAGNLGNIPSDDAPAPTATEAPKPDPAPKPETSGDPRALEALKARIAELESENEDLKGRLSEVSSLLSDTQEELDSARRTLDAENLLAQFDKEVKRFQENARVVQSRNNGLMNENSDLKGRLKSALRKIEKLEKAMKGAA